MGARHGSGSECALDEQDPSLMPFNTLHTIMLHAIKVSLDEWCAISELGLKVSELFDVIIIKSASHHSASSTYLHDSTCSGFNYHRIINYYSNMVDINNAVSQSYHPVLDTHITSRRVTWITAVSASWPLLLSSPRHGACAQRLPNVYRVAPETSRLRQMYPSQLDSLRPENATKGSRMFQASQ